VGRLGASAATAQTGMIEATMRIALNGPRRVARVFIRFSIRSFLSFCMAFKLLIGMLVWLVLAIERTTVVRQLNCAGMLTISLPISYFSGEQFAR